MNNYNIKTLDREFCNSKINIFASLETFETNKKL